MPNPYYTPTGNPPNQTRGTSALVRNEFDSIEGGFDDVYAEILALAAAIGVAVTVSEVPVASASTTDIGNGYGPVLLITGSNPINSFGANYKGGIFLRFQGALQINHSASLQCPGGQPITTQADDACIAVPIGNPANGWRIMAYCRVSQGIIDDIAVKTSSTYANPSWLTSLAWSKITGRPTTLAGYGITDAPQKDGTGATGTWPINVTGFSDKAGVGADVTSAATLDLTNSSRVLRLLGATPITALTLDDNGPYLLTADSAAVFNVPGVLVYTCNPEDSVLLWQDGDGVQHASVLSNLPKSLGNKLINGAIGIDQRNAGAAQTITAGAALAYTVDRWYAYCTGANVTGQRVAGTAPNKFNYRFTGAASVTKIGFAQRIEAANCQDLAGQTATLSVDLANSLLTTVTWTAWYANTEDTFGTLASPTRTQIATGTFTVTSTLTRYSTQISIPSAATTGIEIEFSVGAQTSGTWTIGRAQLEVGGVATAFEYREVASELARCQRYFCAGSARFDGQATLSTSFSTPVKFPVTMRTTPTVSQTNTSNVGFGTGTGSANITQDAYWSARTATGTGAGQFAETFTASAEL